MITQRNSERYLYADRSVRLSKMPYMTERLKSGRTSCSLSATIIWRISL